MPSAAAYGALVARLERESRERPALYKTKLAILAVFGFAVLGGSALLALSASAGLVVGLAMISPILLFKLVKVLWIPVAFGWFLLKALWVRFAPPEGYRLAPGEAPDLVADVERLRIAAGAPPLEGIVIDGDLNAAAATVPRASGILGNRHYLVLGLPLMQLLDREQLLAVIAHEFGHFGGGHNRFSGWIYHVRISWYRVLDALAHSGSALSGVFARFFRWYAPYFNAYSFALARANEYQADATAARLIGAQAAGAALVRVHLGSQRLDRDFWPRLRDSNQHLPEPPSRLYHDMGSTLRQAHDDDAPRLHAALSATADYHDTHPTLAQRLAALDVAPHVPGEPFVPASEALLGPLADTLERRFSDQWREEVEEAWQSNFRNHRDASRRLGELESTTPHDAEQACEYARLVDDLRRDVDAVPLYRAAIALAPDDAFCQFRLGALLLERGDEAGVVHVRRAMDLDSHAVEPGAALLADHHAATGNDAARADAERARQRLREAQQRTARERGRVAKSDVYLPHGLAADELTRFQTQVRALDTVKRAWVVRKHVSDDPNEPAHFVVLIAWRGFIFAEDGNLRRVVDGIDLPGSIIVITPVKRRRIARRIRETAGTPTYIA